MNKTALSWITIMAVSLFMSGLVRADEETDHAALRQLKTVFEEALNTGDLGKLAPYLDDHFVGVPATGDRLASMEELMAFWKKINGRLGAGGSYSIKLDPERSLLYGDIALARGTAEESIHISSGREFHMQTRWSVIGHKQDGQWKVVYVQSTMDPFQNPITVYQTNIIRWTYGVGGVAIGLAVGLVTGWMRRRSTSG